jgi:hypothetical protein
MSSQLDKFVDWSKHPIVVMLIGGFLLWGIQFFITTSHEEEKKRTEHYQFILQQKIKAYYEMQALSNKMYNELRLLNKLVMIKGKKFKTPFEIDEGIDQQCLAFFVARTKFANRHYELYMLQSGEAKKGYEDLIKYVTDEVRPGEIVEFPRLCLGGKNTGQKFYDFDVAKGIGSTEFNKKALDLWLRYIESMASELAYYKITKSITDLGKQED